MGISDKPAVGTDARGGRMLVRCRLASMVPLVLPGAAIVPHPTVQFHEAPGLDVGNRR